jgi:SAM-dependent methyltransferase/8-oxo-dGTP pyrophosphatase MutT (NUDIX family)
VAREPGGPAARQRRRSELLLDRSPWLRVFQDEVELPNGHRISDWVRLEGRDAVLVFAVTTEQQVLMVEQYKYGASRMVQQFPSGYLESEESPLEGAQRELLEETGYRAEGWESLGSFWVDGNRGYGQSHLFFAREAVAVQAPAVDAAEPLALHCVPLPEVSRLLENGQIAELSTALLCSLALWRLGVAPPSLSSGSGKSQGNLSRRTTKTTRRRSGDPMESHQARMQAAYDAVAPQYAVQNAALAPVVQPLAEALAKRVADRLLLDLGCGAGRDLAWFRQAGVRAVGMDLSAGMLGQANKLTPGPLVQGTLTALPFGDGVCAGVWCVAALLHLPHAVIDGALREMRRVLVPGGGLYLGVAEGDGESWEAGVYGEVERFFAYYRPDEFGLRMAQAGFRVEAQTSDVTPRRRWMGFFATSS